ncbi:MAG: response regulator [Planctomycetes bacterium]|nr:response regulator [Planctomycetota bacterium]
MSRILVAEDSSTQVVLIRGILEDEDYEVDVVTNGKQALQRLEEGGDYDLVLTDMVMPEMDGLQLARAIRAHHAGTPVILMTGKGTDELAIEALEDGAAGYVPKSRMSDRLVDEVTQVLHMASMERSYKGLLDCLGRTQFIFELENNVSLIDPLVDLLQQMMTGMHLCDSTARLRAGVVLEHALLNALYRGNLEISPEEMLNTREMLFQGEAPQLVKERLSQPPYCDRKIYLDALLTKKDATFVIRDEGSGFDTSKIPNPGAPDSLEQEGVHGLLLMQTFMDEVVFNDEGNEVRMVKRREV